MVPVARAPAAHPNHQATDGESGGRDRANLPGMSGTAGRKQQEQNRQTEGGAKGADDAQLASVVGRADFGSEIHGPIPAGEELALPGECRLVRPEEGTDREE